MGNMGLFLLTVASYLIKFLTPKPFPVSKFHYPQWVALLLLLKKIANRNQKLPCSHLLICKNLPSCFSVTKLSVQSFKT